MAKRFFYVCAGLFLCALSAFLGTRVVGAQGASTLSVGHINNQAGDGVVGVVNRVLVRGNFNPFRVNNVTPPVPGESPIVAVDEGHAMLANGDVYEIRAEGWVLLGNMLANVNSVEPSRSELGLVLAPNPAARELDATFSLAEPSDVRLKLVDVQGRVVDELGPVRLGSGRHTLSLGLSRVQAAGTFFVRVESEGRVLTGRSVVLR